LILISVLCFISIKYFDAKLSDLENIILVEYTGSYTRWQQELIENYVNMDRNINTFSICSDYLGSLKTPRQSYNNVLICMIDEKYARFDKIKMVNGRFIWQRDIDEAHKYIVIEKGMATDLFSTIDCIGREVELNEHLFKVLGVYEKSDPFTSTISSVSSNTVFIPYSFSDTSSGKNALERQVILFKVRDNISSVIQGAIQKNLEKILNISVSTENIDMKARQARQKVRFTYYIIACISIIYLLKWVIPIWRRIYMQFKNKINDSYFPQVLKENWFGICIFLIMIIVLATLFYLAIKSFKPDLIIDPELIPSRLINAKEISEKIGDYFIKINTEQFIVSPIHAFIIHANKLLTYLCSILVLCCWRVLCILEGIQKVTGDFLHCSD